jgi:Hypothetical protein FLILHELTA
MRSNVFALGLKGRSRVPALTRRFASQQTSNCSSQNPTYQRLVARTPRFLRPTLTALHNAPVTHITAFLILHEITAIIPLFGLAGAFHYYNWLPPYFAEGAWVTAGVEKFERYFKRKGWISDSEERKIEGEARTGEIEKSRGLKWWNRGEGGTRLVVEFATAYAVTKSLLPLRLVLSVWGAPWFARWTVVPMGNAVKRILGRKNMSSIAATNAVVSKKP